MAGIERKPYLERAKTREFWVEVLQGTKTKDSLERFGVTTLGGIVIAAALWNLFEGPWAVKMIARAVEQVPLAPAFLWQGKNFFQRSEREYFQREREERLKAARERLQKTF